ncbi:cellular tumor antigen p53 isoform X2 [Lingula anatina]|uniref:Cellular tumor antigen p53 isoform X2 n=1 Tax=Lingula anatina TaxID=7574 RepID=A0A1S3II34_LINAN|nr:cellular tumor antigen p53 isoform X2 [Lingula anatina]|eukprot:XP_013397877.1 cellular tumor antigen p53 isoform X2 [Lingula anatina]
MTSVTYFHPAWSGEEKKDILRMNSQGNEGVNPPLSQETFDGLWDQLMIQTENGAYTNIINQNQEPEYHYADGGESAQVEVQRFLIAPQQDSIMQLLSSIPSVTQPDAMSPDSQTTAVDSVPSNIPTTVELSGQALQPPHSPLPVMPSNTDYPGPFGFTVSCAKQTKETKSANWTYSDVLKKLFVNIGKSTPIRYKTQKKPPPGSVIRVLPIYMKPEHIQEVVARCPNHMTSKEFGESDVPNTHMVRCEHKQVSYYTDPVTGRHCAIFPFEGPQAGSEWVTNLFQFLCFSSCVGGQNRRQVQLIFTLENDGQILGRRALEIRVCACPGRDRKSEEKTAQPEVTNMGKKPTRVTHSTQITRVGPAAKKRKLDSKDEIFTITVRGRENYEILCRLRDSLEMSNMLSPDQVNNYKQRQLELQKQPTLSRIPSGLANLSGSFSQQLTEGSLKPPPLPFSSMPSLTRGDTQPVSSTQKELVKMEPDTVIPVPKTSQCQVSSQGEVADMTIAKWLTSLGFAAYADNFHQIGLTTMYQLEDCSLQDLEKLSIGTDHRNKIWKALSAWKTRRAQGGAGATPRGLSGASDASTISLASQISGGYSPGVFEVTRYTFKHTVSISDDHPYSK